MKTVLFSGDLEVLDALYPETAERIRGEIENLRKENGRLALENEELEEELRFFDVLPDGVDWEPL